MKARAEFRLNQKMLDLVDEHAARNRHSRSDQFRIIVEDWLMDRAAKHADPDPITELTPEQVDAFLYPQRRAAAKLVDPAADYDAEAS